MSDVSQDLINNFNAQLDAHKQALNEYINANLMMKAQLNLLTKQFQELNNQLTEANAKILELTPKENTDAANPQ